MMILQQLYVEIMVRSGLMAIGSMLAMLVILGLPPASLRR